MKDQEVVSNAIRLARISYPFYFIYPVLEVFGGAVRGMGYSLQSMGIIITCLCVIRVSLLAVFSSVFHTLESLASVYPITWACAAVSFSVFFAIVITRKIRSNPEPA